MKPVNFDEDYATLMDEMKLRIDEPENEMEIISDGVMQPNEYFSKEIRLAWILKEAYDYSDGGGEGGWSYFGLFDKENFDFKNNPTFNSIIHTSFRIHNNFMKYKEDEKSIDIEMSKIIRNVAIINTRKLPSKKGSSTNGSHLWESIEKSSDLLEKQINLLNPNVIIFGGTFKFYKDLLKFEDSEIVKGNPWYIAKDNKLYIIAYHPAQTTTSKLEYVNSIVSVVEKWKLNEL